LPNPWGIFDTHGNVLEWLQDWHAPSEKDTSDPPGPAQGEIRVLRGGSFVHPASSVRSANCTFYHPSNLIDVCGFRPARTYR